MSKTNGKVAQFEFIGDCDQLDALCHRSLIELSHRYQTASSDASFDPDYQLSIGLQITLRQDNGVDSGVVLYSIVSQYGSFDDWRHCNKRTEEYLGGADRYRPLSITVVGKLQMLYVHTSDYNCQYVFMVCPVGITYSLISLSLKPSILGGANVWFGRAAGTARDLSLRLDILL